MLNIKEQTNQTAENNLQFFLATQLTTLFHLIGENETDQNKKQKLFEAVRSTVLEFLEDEHPEEIAQADRLLAVAILNLDKINTDSERQKLIAEYFPTKEQELVNNLQELQQNYQIGTGTITKLIQTITQPKRFSPKSTIEALGIVTRKLAKRPDRKACTTLFDFITSIWPNLNLEERDQFKSIFIQLRDALARVDGVGAAELSIKWLTTIYEIGVTRDSDHPELGFATPDSSTPRLIQEVLRFVPVRAIDSIGYALKYGASELTTIELLRQKFSNVLAGIHNYPDAVINGVIDAYVETGFVQRYKQGKIKLTKKGQEIPSLSSTELQTVLLARQLFTGVIPKPKEKSASWDDIDQYYDNQREKTAIPNKELVISGNSRRILLIGDLNIGHIAFDKNAAKAFVNQIKELPEEKRPHHIVVSGLVAGGYHFRKKNMREQLAITGMNAQFNFAREFLDMLLEIGVEVSYVLSSEDFEIARNYTIFAYQALDHSDNPQADPSKSFVPYWMADQMQFSDRWDILHEVQVNAAMQYYFRCGRRMRSADEVRALNIVRDEYKSYSAEELAFMPWAYVRQEEFFIFFDALDKLIKGETLPKHYNEILEMENFPIPGRVFSDFNCYNGLRLTSVTDTGTTVSYLQHNGLNAPNSVAGNPIASFGNIIGALAVAEKPIPHEWVNFHGNLARGAELDEGGQTIGLLSTPGFSSPDLLDYRTQTLTIPGSPMLRQAKKGFLPSQGGMMREVYDNGEHTVLYPITKEFMDFSALSSDQILWLFLADVHAGSQAAYLDGYLRFLDYAFKHEMANHPTVMAFLGDQIQGRNVRTMPQESALVGLPSLEHQQELSVLLHQLALTQNQPLHDLPAWLANIEKTYLVTGNHEQNSLPRELQTDFLLPLAQNLQFMLGNHRVKRLQTMTSQWGEHIVYPGGITDIHGGIQAFLTHKYDQAKFGSKDPIEGALKIIRGFGSDFSQVRLMAMGDRHVSLSAIPHPNILSLVVGSMSWSTGYERGIGVKSTPRATLVKWGGNLPPEIHYFSHRFIAQHPITSGPFSDEYLADVFDIRTDAKYEPHHGLYNVGRSEGHDALQNFILTLSEKIVLGNQSWLGAPLQR